MKEVGFRHNEGKPKWSFAEFKSLEPLIRVLEYGVHKYTIYIDSEGKTYKGSEVTRDQVKELNLKVLKSGINNWKKGLDKVETTESLLRHAMELANGKENDIESGLPHTGHIMCNAMFYQYHSDNNSFVNNT